MTGTAARSRWPAWHEWFKFTVYVLLAINLALFFEDEWEASAYVFGGGVPAGEIFTAFAASIDTLAWVVLLLLFELETYQIPDDRLKPPLTTGLHVLRVVCYVSIVYAFLGYVAKVIALYGYMPVSAAGVCHLDGYSVLLALDEYEPLDAGSCTGLARLPEVYRLDGAAIVAAPAVWLDTLRLAWVDVVNAATWLLVVAVLELDVRLQEHHALIGRWLAFSRYAKYVMYTVLFGAAVYWGVEGTFLDFWDAFLWLVAFVFIEMNVFEWREERLEDARGETSV
ncbi:MAG: hypothetical protein PVF57_05280 [Pseudomonadales bacterium]|jgi:hypothetical protein